MKNFVRQNVRAIALSIFAPLAGFVIFLLLEMGFKIKVPDLVANITNFILAACFAWFVFPRLPDFQFGKVTAATFFKKIGFYFPKQGWKHIFLGLILSACTLSGMLVASILTGKYTPDLSRISFEHLIFSLNPAFWEEFFYRGAIMIFLIGRTKSIKKAAAIQVGLFAILHIKGFQLWNFIDIITLILLGILFTFTAWQTKSLVAGIVFHYFHDALLYFVQLPSGASLTDTENILFYGLLWAMIGVGMLVIRWLGPKWVSPELTSPYQEAMIQQA